MPVGTNEEETERRVVGDGVDYNGAATGGDASFIKPHFGKIAGIDLAGPHFDFDLNGGDFSLIKPLFGNFGAYVDK